MKIKKWEMALIIALVVTFLISALIPLEREQQDISDKMIRLHVVANSDSDADQSLKLKVRDKILNTVTPLLSGIHDRNEAEALINSHMDSIKEAASGEIRSEGYGYGVTAKISVEDFPTRDYDTFSLPAGKYTALRVVIGSGEGHNWWCVIFPPLCLSAAESTETAKQSLTNDEVALITNDSPKYVLKFKTIEVFDEVKAWMGI